MALRFLARSVLSKGTSTQEPASLLRQSIPHHRTEWRLLPDPEPGFRQDLANPDWRGLCLRLEGLEIHHALETALEWFDQQSGFDRGATIALGRQSRPRIVSTAAKFRK